MADTRSQQVNLQRKILHKTAHNGKFSINQKLRTYFSAKCHQKDDPETRSQSDKTAEIIRHAN